MQIRWEVEGLQELERQLVSLGAKMGLKALRKAGRKAMEPVKDQMVQNAPFDDQKSDHTSEYKGSNPKARNEHMRDTIKITTSKAGKKSKGRALSVRVGPTKAHAAKAIAAEYGTTKKKSQEATPFMRQALYDNRVQVVNTFKTILAQEIEKAVRAAR